jgi:hypothetical protein
VEACASACCAPVLRCALPGCGCGVALSERVVTEGAGWGEGTPSSTWTPLHPPCRLCLASTTRSGAAHTARPLPFSARDRSIPTELSAQWFGAGAAAVFVLRMV